MGPEDPAAGLEGALFERLVGEGAVRRGLGRARALLYGTDFGRVPDEVSDFVQFYRGLTDYSDGRIRWGDSHFDKLTKGSLYDYRARQVRVVHALKSATTKEETSAALTEFEALAKDAKAPVSVRNEGPAWTRPASTTSRKDYEKALLLLRLGRAAAARPQVAARSTWSAPGSSTAPARPQPLGLRLSHRAGRLRAFASCSCRRSICCAGSIYKDKWPLPLGQARLAGSSCGATSRRSIPDQRPRGPREGPAVALRAALESGPAETAEQRYQLIQKERDQINDYASPFATPGLTAKLHEIYDLMLSEAERAAGEILLDRALDDTADRFLRAEEKPAAPRLRDRPRQSTAESSGATARKELALEDVPPKKGEVLYPFTGEYWNDELRSLRFFLKSRCYEIEGEE